MPREETHPADRSPGAGANPQSVGALGRPVDLAIICMLDDVELGALEKTLTAQGATMVGEPWQNTYTYEIPTKNGAKLNAIVHSIGKADNINAAIATSSLLYRYMPQNVFLFGIAGTLNEAKYRMGDVVIGRDVMHRPVSKITENQKMREFLFSINAVDVGADAQDRIRQFMRRHPEGQAVPPARGTGKPFHVHHAKIYTWDMVLDSAETREDIIRQDRTLAVVEMESAGFFNAISHYRRYYLQRPGGRPAHGTVDGFVFRGISDPAAGKSHSDALAENHRETAAMNAAQVMMDFVSELDMVADLHQQPAATPFNPPPVKKTQREAVLVRSGKI